MVLCKVMGMIDSYLVTVADNLAITEHSWLLYGFLIVWERV